MELSPASIPDGLAQGRRLWLLGSGATGELVGRIIAAIEAEADELGDNERLTEKETRLLRLVLLEMVTKALGYAVAAEIVAANEQGLPFREIAAALGLSEPTVSARARAYKRTRDPLGERTGGGTLADLSEAMGTPAEARPGRNRRR